MERKKERKLVITFPTTTAAMAMEEACEPKDGRLIPIPREISGGCGLAWCTEPAHEKKLIKLMAEKNIFYQDKRIIELYA